MTLLSNGHTYKDKNSWSDQNLHYMIKVAKAISYNQNFILPGLSSLTPMLYTCIKSWYLIKLSLQKSSTSFHQVSCRLRVCSMVRLPWLSCPYNYGKILILIKKTTHSSSSKPRTAEMMILSLGAMTGLKKCCITNHHICSGYFTQVSKPWAVGLLFFNCFHVRVSCVLKCNHFTVIW